jgi:hypothetical protein
LPQGEQPIDVLLQRLTHGSADIGCRWEGPRQVVVNGFVGHLIGDHVADDVRDEVRRRVSGEGLMGLNLVHLEQGPGLVDGEDMPPEPIPSSAPPQGLIQKKAIDAGHSGQVVRVNDSLGAVGPYGPREL